MDVEEIVDRESLKACFITYQGPAEVFPHLALRSALRLVPLVALSAFKSRPIDRHLMSCFRALATSQTYQGLNDYSSKLAGVLMHVGDECFDMNVDDGAIRNGPANAAYSLGNVLYKDIEDALNDFGDTTGELNGQESLFFWEQIREDIREIIVSKGKKNGPLWSTAQDPLEKEWNTVSTKLRRDTVRSNEVSARTGPVVDWSFWIDWYQRALDGTETRWDMLTEIAQLDDKIWQGDPVTLMDKINAIWDRYKSGSSPKAQAAVVDFSFDAQLKLMTSMGYDEDAAHLRDPERIRAFLDDIEELRDSFQDFADFASEKQSTSNAPRMLATGSEKLLREFERCENKDHIRARRILTLGKHVQGLSMEEANRGELGETLAEMLDTNLETLNEICRKHFLPSVARLEPLNDLDLGDVSPDDLIDRFEEALALVDQADGTTLQPLAPDDVTLLRDMLSELRETRASLAEARSDEYRSSMRTRFARRAGALGSTLGRYIQKGSEVAEDAGQKFDKAVKQYKRYDTIADLVAWLRDFIGLGGG